MPKQVQKERSKAQTQSQLRDKREDYDLDETPAEREISRLTGWTSQTTRRG